MNSSVSEPLTPTNATERKLLADHGFVHVTGISRSKGHFELSPIGYGPVDYGHFNIGLDGTMVIVTPGGEVWLGRPGQAFMYGKPEIFAALGRRFWPYGHKTSIYLPNELGSMVDGVAILARLKDPDWVPPE